MSDIKVGDRVACYCGGGNGMVGQDRCGIVGVVVGIDGDHLALTHDLGYATIGRSDARVIAPAPAVAPFAVGYLVHPSAARGLARGLEAPPPEFPELSDRCGVTHAEWSAALAQINDQAKALDTVRRFLGEASFASCSLADQRRAREVMGVVLAAIDSTRAGK